MKIAVIDSILKYFYNVHGDEESLKYILDKCYDLNKAEYQEIIKDMAETGNIEIIVGGVWGLTQLGLGKVLALPDNNHIIHKAQTTMLTSPCYCGHSPLVIHETGKIIVKCSSCSLSIQCNFKNELLPNNLQDDIKQPTVKQALDDWNNLIAEIEKKVTNINNNKPHKTGVAICDSCLHTQVSVAPVGTNLLECSRCGKMESRFANELDPWVYISRLIMRIEQLEENGGV